VELLLLRLRPFGTTGGSSGGVLLARVTIEQVRLGRRTQVAACLDCSHHRHILAPGETSQ
jgi:hypothetical protein